MGIKYQAIEKERQGDGRKKNEGEKEEIEKRSK